jgi:hypothetical protein
VLEVAAQPSRHGEQRDGAEPSPARIEHRRPDAGLAVADREPEAAAADARQVRREAGVVSASPWRPASTAATTASLPSRVVSTATSSTA